MSKNLTLAIGGAEDFADYEIAIKGIDATLSQHNIKVSDILRVYGIGKLASIGGYTFAQQWCQLNGVEFRSGQPKFYGDNNRYNPNATVERNEILSKACDAFILLQKGTSTGGNTIINAFEKAGIPVYKIDEDDGLATKSPEDTRRIYSRIAQTLLVSSVTLDVETTGLSEIKDDVIELAIVDSKSSKVILNSFIYSETPINPLAAAVNNITPDMLAGQPTLGDAWKGVHKQLKGKIIVASNSDFDEKMICYGLEKYGVDAPSNLWTCLQALYCKYSGIKKKKLKTEIIARQLGIEPGTHRALADALAQAEILKAMAECRVPNLDVSDT